MRPSSALVRWAGRVLPGGAGPEWRDAMRAEVESIPSGTARLAFACGCVGAAVRERMRRRTAPTGLRVLAVTLATVFVLQAVVESHQWRNGNDASRWSYLVVVAVVVGSLTAALLAVATDRAALRPVTLVAGSCGGLVAAALWTAVAWVPPSIPTDAAGALVLVTACAGLAGGLVVLVTRSPRDALAAGLLAAATGTALVFSVAELTIQLLPGRIPDIVGPVMPAGSTATQVLRENRIEIVDGYVLLLFLVAALSTGLLLVARFRGRRHVGVARSGAWEA